MAKGDATKPAVVGITEEQVGKMIAAALQGLPSEERVKVLIVEATTDLLKALKAALPEMIIETFEIEAKKNLENQPEFITKEQALDLLANVATFDWVNELLAKSFQSGTVENTLIEGESIKGFLTEERVRELIAEALLRLCPSPGDALLDGVPELEPFDDSLLYDLEIDGRPLTTDDILSGTKSADGVVTIVTRDGKKHVITRK